MLMDEQESRQLLVLCLCDAVPEWHRQEELAEATAVIAPSLEFVNHEEMMQALVLLWMTIVLL